MPKHYGPLLRFLHSAIDQSVSSSLENLDLTSAQGHIIGYVAHRETPPCPKDIEEAFHLSHPTVSGLLSRLEKKDFIELRPDEKDRRCKRVYVRPKGTERLSRFHQTILETEEKIVQGFTPEEQVLFRSLLERAVSNVGGWPACKNQKEEPIE